jgi:hypothetical protein
MNLEGMTGYWMTPSAWVLDPDHAALSINSHVVGRVAPGTDDQLGVAPLPDMEMVARYTTLGVRDLSFNGKLDYIFSEGTSHPTGIALGIQDIWGGARLFHSDYGVVTQRWGLVEASLGWGTGTQDVEVTWAGAGMARLGGWFWGAQLRAPLPDSSPWQVYALHDYDGMRSTSGLRNELKWGAATVDLDAGWDWTWKRWDLGTSLNYGFSAPMAPVPADSTRLFRLRYAPWMQTFVGTEVGEFDAQVAAEGEAIVQPVPMLVGYARVRTLVYATENFQEGHVFAPYRQDPTVWLEGAGAGVSCLREGAQGLWVQAGTMDGSWQGSSFEAAMDRDRWGFRLGGLAGAWYSTWWHGSRQVVLPWLDWDSRGRSWFVQMDAGRFWNQDDGWRVRVGRRYWRWKPSLAISSTSHVVKAEGKLEVDLSGIGWKPNRFFAFEPEPLIGQGLSSVIANRNGEGNPLRPGLAQDPPFVVRGRDGTWP